MEGLIRFLEEKAEKGEAIDVAYGGGSSPGRVRKLIIVGCDGENLKAREANQPGKGPRLKTYKINRILWVQDKMGQKITNNLDQHEQEEAFPSLSMLEDYIEHFGPELKEAGWFLKVNPSAKEFGICPYYKNGKPKKTPSVLIWFFDRSTDEEWDEDANDFVQVEKQLTGRERPWRVDSWRVRTARTFGPLPKAMEFFMEEARASDPTVAKGVLVYKPFSGRGE